MRCVAVVGYWIVLIAAVSLWSPAASQIRDRQFEAGQTADLQNWQWRARQGVAPSEAEKAVAAVVEAIGRRDCNAAVTQLNAGLAKGHADVMLLAGAMYEEGLCIKPNWERAVGLYERAAAAGRSEAMARIAAGYASQAGGRDLAATVWWALRAGTPVPDTCGQVTSLVNDADKFVAALKAWPAGQLQACAHAAAVMATVQGEAGAANYAAAFGLRGTVRFTYNPSGGQLDVVEQVSSTSPVSVVVTDAAVRESEQQAQRTAFSAALRQLTERALKRYEKQPGLPAQWRVTAEYAYGEGR
jgi:hypothetical protein